MKVIPDAPLFRDPIYDGAADPVIVWNKQEEQWWIFYTNRRAYGVKYGVGYLHGTDIGIASSVDGKSWLYRGIAEGLHYEPGRNTYWAPEILEEDGIYHMYVSYVRGIPKNWSGDRYILHYTSTDLWHWEFQSKLSLSSDKVIDACVIKLGTEQYKMWYKDEVHGSHSYTAYSSDLYHWEAGEAEITDCPHEGPNVFFFEERYWMITDIWKGLGVYSSEDASTWTRRMDILYEGGERPDDGTMANHADVLVHKGRAYIFYFTHPEVSYKQRHDENFTWEYRHRRSSLQVAELKVEGENLICDRNHVELDLE